MGFADEPIVTVAGDEVLLCLYQRDEHRPVLFEDDVAPYRGVRDFSGCMVPGGASLLGEMIEAASHVKTTRIGRIPLRYADPPLWFRSTTDNEPHGDGNSAYIVVEISNHHPPYYDRHVTLDIGSVELRINNGTVELFAEMDESIDRERVISFLKPLETSQSSAQVHIELWPGEVSVDIESQAADDSEPVGGVPTESEYGTIEVRSDTIESDNEESEQTDVSISLTSDVESEPEGQPSRLQGKLSFKGIEQGDDSEAVEFEILATLTIHAKISNKTRGFVSQNSRNHQRVFTVESRREVETLGEECGGDTGDQQLEPGVEKGHEQEPPIARVAYWRGDLFDDRHGQREAKFRLVDPQGYSPYPSAFNNFQSPDSSEPNALRFANDRLRVFAFKDLGFTQGGYRANRAAWDRDIEIVNTIDGSTEYAHHLYIGTIGRNLPLITGSHEAGNASIWNELYQNENLRDRTIAIVSAHVIRNHGFPISHRISWERTAQDCLEALRHPRMKPLADFAHLIVRVGLTGAMHIYKRPTVSQEVALYFDPVGFEDKRRGVYDAFYRDANLDGRVLGSNSVLAASIIRELVLGVETGKIAFDFGLESTYFKGLTNQESADQIGEGIRRGIGRCQRLFDTGYPKNLFDSNFHGKPAEKTYDDPCVIFNSDDSQDENRVRFGIGRTIVSKNPTWSLLQEAEGYHPIRLACQIAYRGLDVALSRDKVKAHGSSRLDERDRDLYRVIAPIVRFGHFTTLDREEIENYRNIDATVRQYFADKSRKKPLSIAVFGPPGSGKSFGITEITKSITGNQKYEPLKYNLAQFSSPSDLEGPLLEVNNATKGDGVPLVFFDEFDSRLGENDLGWLRYFLAPMEDGKFKIRERNLDIGRAVFVFAGGTSQSFQDFAAQDLSSDDEQVKFVKAKGPDFVSRLSGHLNTIGINPRDGDDTTYAVRRAVQLRSMLEMRGLVGKGGVASVHPVLLEAMLGVSRYTHGARSMKLVLSMCVTGDGMIRLPSVDQLNMHTDGEHFRSAYENALRNPIISPGHGVMNMTLTQPASSSRATETNG